MDPSQSSVHRPPPPVLDNLLAIAHLPCREGGEEGKWQAEYPPE